VLFDEKQKLSYKADDTSDKELWARILRRTKELNQDVNQRKQFYTTQFIYNIVIPNITLT